MRKDLIALSLPCLDLPLKVASEDPEQPDIGQTSRGGRARRISEQRHLPQDIILFQNGDLALGPRLILLRDGDCSLYDLVEGVPAIPLGEYLLPFFARDRRRDRCQAAQAACFQVAEDLRSGELINESFDHSCSSQGDSPSEEKGLSPSKAPASSAPGPPARWR